MDYSRPLEYQSLKSLLKHMDPSLRIQLRTRCPGIKTANEVEPLRINSLKITSIEIHMDGTSYQIGLTPGEVISDHAKGVSSYLQLRIETEDDVSFERIVYSKPMSHAMDYLVKKLLNGKKRQTEVKHLAIGTGARFPDGLKKLKVSYLDGNPSVADFIDFENHPLKMIHVEELSDHPMIKTAKLLIINKLPFWHTLHPRTHFKLWYPSNQEFQCFLDSIKKKPAESETHFSFGFLIKEDVVRLLRFLEFHEDCEVVGEPGSFEEETSGEYRFIFKVNGYTQLCVYFEETNWETKMFCEWKWILNVKVQFK